MYMAANPGTTIDTETTIEKIVFDLPQFIKHIPHHRRPTYITEMLGPVGPYYATDYTSFEGTLTAEFMEVCELMVYRHCLQNYPELADMIVHTIGGKNVAKSRFSTITVRGCRMSGDMCTSLGNGLSNYIVMSWLCKKNGAMVSGVFEGDDGLFSAGKVLDFRPLENSGFIVKVETHDKPEFASFCGNIVSCGRFLLRDPRKVLCTFGWSHSPLASCPRHRAGLLRAKALSLGNETPYCPVVRALALRAIRDTVGAAPLWQSGWKEHEAAKMRLHEPAIVMLLEDEVPMGVRIDFALLYGLSPAEQVEMERLILTSYDPLGDEIFESYVENEQLIHYRENYVRWSFEKPPQVDGALTAEQLSVLVA